MKIIILTTILLFTNVLGSTRDDIAGRIVTDIGVTLLTKADILKIMICTEQEGFKDPENQDLTWSAAKHCVISSTANKGVQTMFNNFNNCLKNGGGTLDQFEQKVHDRVTAETKDVADKVFKKTAQCKKACAAPDSDACREQCMEQFYTALKPLINKPKLDEICIKLSETDLTANEYKCSQEAAKQTMNTNGYQCAKLQKSLIFFRLFDVNYDNVHGNVKE